MNKKNEYRFSESGANALYTSKLTPYPAKSVPSKITVNFGNYFDKIVKISLPYLKKQFSEVELQELFALLKKYQGNSIQEYVDYFDKVYCELVKRQYQMKTTPYYDANLCKFIEDKNSHIKLIWGDAYQVLRRMKSESVHLMVTSPPYYNAREYSQWENLNDYFSDMKEVITECYRVLDNHRVFVFNVGDIYDNDRLITKSVWGKRRIPLGAYFIKLFEEIGFTFVDDFIWDKGEVQTQRHKHTNTPYPFYQYPVNCYEHILIFHKHRLDKTRYPCPICGCLKTNDNTQSEIGLQSWECANEDCFVRSKSNRGKRFSLKTNITQRHHTEEFKIPENLIRKWRRDIVNFPPVIKINAKGENILGHSAPFPQEIPEMAVIFYTYPGEFVLDPFAGSFTTTIVAAKLNRIGIGIELNKKLFYDKVLKIIEKETTQGDLYAHHKKYAEYDLLHLPQTHRQKNKRK
uniref:Methyltransferase n=1 Tax=candidate division WOR-3 bacterium TaxID=2052148 RepID=A0A7C4TH64_UNCW3